APPRTSGASPGTPISYFQPAMALKLIPKGPAHPMTVQLADWKAASADHPKPVVTARIAGDSVERAWLEYSQSNHTWAPAGRPLWKAPYIFTVDQTKLPEGRVQLRVVAANLWEERAASQPFAVDISTAAATH